MNSLNSNDNAENRRDDSDPVDKTFDENQSPDRNDTQEEPNALPEPGITKTYSTKNLPTGKQREKLGSGLIQGVLGEGGMAKVYKIWNEEMEVFRAVKILLPDMQEKNLQRFMTEIKISSKLHHPNIIEIHYIGKWKGLPYIEMEFLEGETLERLILRHGALDAEFCCSVCLQIAQALAYAHSLEMQIYGKKYTGVIHRDLKPANIMILPCGSIKLMDFGIARPMEIGLHTMEGYLVGTPQYFSPEQISGQNLDARTDIYSLGVILYEMLCGKKAFPQDTLPAVIRAVDYSEYRKLKECGIKINPSLAACSEKCMRKEREKRFETAGALANELQSVYSRLKNASAKKAGKQQDRAEIIDKSRRKEPVKQNDISKKKIPTSAAALVLLLLIIIGAGGFYVFKSFLNKQIQPPATGVEKPAVAEPLPERAEEKQPAIKQSPESEPAKKSETPTPEKQKTEKPEIKPAAVIVKKNAAEPPAPVKSAKPQPQTEPAKPEEKLAATEPVKKEEPLVKEEPAGTEAIAPPEQKKEIPPKGMVWIEGGTFKMGSNDYDDEKPPHDVTVSGFWMDKTEVTQEAYEREVGKKPSYFEDCPTCPVENVSWHEAKSYCEKVGKRLPTEAEWEYAARAGSSTKYYWGTSMDGDYAWYNGNSGSKTHAVGTRKPNAWGLYDMSGNVWEWCSDWYDQDYYKSSSTQDPQGPASGKSRVLRGGSWDNGDLLRSADRGRGEPGDRNDSSGFRCVRSR